MPDPAPHPVPESPVPGTDPRSIRDRLPAELVGEFDAEWALVMDRAKVSMELAGVQELLRKWRHIAVAEQRSPGTHARVMAKAAEILATGQNSTAGSYEDMRALIRNRLGR
jgi:hypothetical protein